MRPFKPSLACLLLVSACVQPKDVVGADGRSWRRGETHNVDGCTVTLTNGWLAESDGWSGALYFDVANEGDSTTPCAVVGALVDASIEPVSVTSKSNILEAGERRTWTLKFESPAIAGITATGAWLYAGIRGSDPRSETGFHIYELPTDFEHDYE